MNRRVGLPDQFRDVPFSRRDALASGVAPGRLRSGDLEHPFHGVLRLVDGPSDLRWRCRAYQERMNPAHCFSHATAAELYGLPLPLYAASGGLLHVAATAPARAPYGSGVVGHRLAPQRWSRNSLVQRDYVVDRLCEFPVSAPEFVWAQLAEALDPDDLVALGDAIVGGAIDSGIADAGPLGAIESLREVVRLHIGCRGAKTMAGAIDRIRVGSLSRPESLVRVMLLRAGLPEPLPNRRVYDRTGTLLAMPDLCWPDYRVLIEYQGDLHRTSKAKFRGDISRIEEYTDGDWSALQASADDVFGDPDPFLARAWRRLTSRGWDPGRRQLRHIAGARP